jgi:chromosome segregation ATPase
VQQRKAAQHEASRLRAELDKLQPQLAASSGRVSELQAANASLRVAVNELKQRLLLAAPADPVEGRTAASGVLVHSSGSARAAGELEVAELQLQRSQRASEASMLRAELATLQQENAGLREELGSFDPAFFEEVEDLKHAHHKLQQTAAAQARLIRQLQGLAYASGGGGGGGNVNGSSRSMRLL